MAGAKNPGWQSVCAARCATNVLITCVATSTSTADSSAIVDWLVKWLLRLYLVEPHYPEPGRITRHKPSPRMPDYHFEKRCEDVNWDAVRKEIVNILDDDKYKDRLLGFNGNRECMAFSVYNSSFRVLIPAN